MENRLIGKMPLENGLTLELYDRSRIVAGDRWLVSFAVRLEVPVVPEYFIGDDSTDVSLEAVMKAVGDKAVYQFEKERNFISEDKKQDVFDGLKQLFLDANLGYLSSRNFPSRLILRQYGLAVGSSLNRQRQ